MTRTIMGFLALIRSRRQKIGVFSSFPVPAKTEGGHAGDFVSLALALDLGSCTTFSSCLPTSEAAFSEALLGRNHEDHCISSWGGRW